MTRRCPRCGGEMRDIGRDRTVRGGVWYVLVCPKCHHVKDEFKPKRKHK